METVSELGALSAESTFSDTPTDSCSNAASMSLTPPTTVSPDSMSLASDPDIPKLDTVTAPLLDSAILTLHLEQQAVQDQSSESRQETPTASAIVVADSPQPADTPSTTRPRRARNSLPVYNLSQLSQLSSNRRSKHDAASEKRRRTISEDTLVNGEQKDTNASTDTLQKTPKAVQNGIDALNMDWSISGPDTPKGARKNTKSKASQPPAPAPLERRATRRSGLPAETITTTIAALTKKTKKTLGKVQLNISLELRRLQDTNEFAHIDTAPIRYTVWSNGKYVDPTEEREASSSRKRTKESETELVDTDKNQPEPEKQEPSGPAVKKRRVKKWLDKGLYAGQEAPTDISKGFSAHEKKMLAAHPELKPSDKINKVLPAPIFNGLRLIAAGRDFKLPYDVCNPLPPGQPKPTTYRTITKNRFVGDAAAYWKKQPVFEDSLSKCVCKPEDGCGEDCQNRIMLYECDDTNCNVGKALCQNRAFQDLRERKERGNPYRVGVEVFKTADRGYGVRSNRFFAPGQIIMEYTGEIITVDECERRMNEEYKDNECYYLMSFDQNMIIDATTGSIARFVNHSCSPNCRMIKWIVSGQPRMALFAGDRPIMTGEELTYDYKFDPFSAKNVQKCLCGSPNCIGVLGPKPKEPKPAKEAKESKDAKKSVKGSVKAGKRKLKELLAGEQDEEEASTAAKKRKIKTATGVKGAKVSLSATSIKAAKGAAKGAVTAIKRSVSSISVTAKTALGRTGGKVQRHSTTNGVVKKYGKKIGSSATVKTSSRSSSLTIVAVGAKNTPKKVGGTSKNATPKSAASTASARNRTQTWKARASASTPTSAAKSAKSVKSDAARSRSALDLSRSTNRIRLVTE
ncbi:putative histone-lysine n-methyltransferase [Rhypophila decipiens]